MEASRFRIPPTQVDAFETLLGLSDDDFDRLAAAFSSVEDGDPEEAVAALERQGPTLGMHPRQFVSTVFAFDSYRRDRGWNAEDAARRLAVGENSPAQDEASVDRLWSRLSRLLSLRALSVIVATSEAMNVERTFSRVEIQTDLRPVFAEPEPVPVSTLILHRLKVDYFDTAGEEQSLYVTLDELDVQEMIDRLTESQNRSAVLRSYLSERDVPLARYPRGNE